MDKKVPEIAAELTGILSQIKGVQKVSEELTLSYIVVIDEDGSREGVDKVGTALSAQAEKYGFALDVFAVTEKEVKEAKDKMAEHLADGTTFKS